MARRNHDDALGVTGAETVIGAGVTVHGELASQADIMVDGLMDGNITTEGDVTIGVNARIKATVKGRNVTVSGHLTGDIHADGEVTIRETGQVVGDITSSTGLSIIPGGVFVGRNHMKVISELEPIPELGSSAPPKPPRKI